MPTELEPADRLRCQCDITPSHGPFVLGPRPKPQRCSNAPVLVVHEKAPGVAGRLGAMSLCARCLAEFAKQAKVDDYRLEAITPTA